MSQDPATRPSAPALLLPLFVVAALGVVHLPHPLHGDAVLYQTGARAMASGETLYRDFWDLKQPGIYVFHWAAGTLFGFGEIGLHTLEMATYLAVALAQVVLLRRVLRPAWLASFVPVASFGYYYLVTTDWHLTQPAILLSAPLFVLLAVPGLPARRPWASWALAGAAAAVAVAFKFAIAPLVALLLAAGVALDDRNDCASFVGTLRRRLLPFAAGAVFVGGAAVLWLQWHGGWDWFVWTQTAWRPEAIAVRGGHPVDRVVESSVWFAKRFAPWLLLAAAAPIGWRGLREERLFVLAGLWLTGGAVLASIEPFAGWEFDFLVLVVPVAILAMRGVQGILQTAAIRRFALKPLPVTCAIVAVAILPGLERWLPKAREFAAHAPRLPAGEFDYQRALDSRYEAAWRATAFLREANSVPGEVYVFGDPIVVLMADRPSASPVHGWAWEIQPSPVWRRVENDLRRNRPPYIFVAPAEDSLIAERGAGIRELLADAYVVRERNGIGTWYEAAPMR